ncbi:MBL fold metallo-hydrolase [Microvirga antarctica]|uniref:MBL fold metallo-hydrolase n=1 Tax=Microvirga antarctica TaxID=2819233 RepID=UPI001B30BB56|nr:MBL fold metallo-hydrolase [Microvirga antarctica]
MVGRALSSGDLQIRFWGVRGSTCASGAQFVEFGGHTPCVEVRCGERLFIVDAGTGLSALGTHLANSAPDTVDLLLSHLHLDHISGLPFFKPALLSNDRVIRTFCGNLGGESAKASLERLYAPPLFPISLDQLPAHFEHHGFNAGETLSFADGTLVHTHLLNHPGGSTGYRFTHAGRSVCYISDIEHTVPWPDPALTAFVRDADLMIYDGMFSDAEYTRCQGWGHSTWHKGVELAKAANVKALAIFHIFPGHDDTFLRASERQMQELMPTAFVARERQTIAFPAIAPGPAQQTQQAARQPAGADESR